MNEHSASTAVVTREPEVHHGRSPLPFSRHPRAAQGSLEWERLEDLAFRHGDGPESYLATEPHGEFLLWRGGLGAVTLEVDRRQWHVPGGLLTSGHHKPGFIAELAALARHERAVLSVYSVGEEDRPLFENAGFQVTKFGEEPVLDLSGLDWSGKAFEWVRRQTNFCRRHGLSCSEISLDSGKGAAGPLPVTHLDGEDWTLLKRDLQEIEAGDLAGRPFDKPLRLFEGQLYPDQLHRRRLFVARQSGSGVVEAYCVANPYLNGTGWAIEMYRKRTDATRGVVPFLIREIIDQLAREGVQEISLSLVPGRGLDQSTPRECRWARWALRLWYRLSPPGFNLVGQEHFKTRFRPRFRNRYMAIAPGASLESLLSFMRVSNALALSPVRLLTHSLRRRWW